MSQTTYRMNAVCCRWHERTSRILHRHISLSWFRSRPDLDGKFAAFGRVTKGMEVVDAINKGPVIERAAGQTCPVEKGDRFPV